MEELGLLFSRLRGSSPGVMEKVSGAERCSEQWTTRWLLLRTVMWETCGDHDGGSCRRQFQVVVGLGYWAFVPQAEFVFYPKCNRHVLNE